ncbi:hypothetical protein Pla175_17630 [Pirellulimonas nuda]|uniref:Uncharacterized protein n=1 Tax=Pirellulimonas nuda TaxID=2528009 RepID=A0A518DA69_9BACT|nr:ABC transporter ATP-binding protein [Pirellulimonas nuda]QDU88387.1 hypothetical protein Pla175_17630 [Pirellulimonas nuda]
MPQFDVEATCRVPSGFAVDQVRGMFDLKVEKTARVSYSVELPASDELIDGRPWRIGVIVGPSGSGKSTVARQAYGDRFVEGHDWPSGKAVIDSFPGVPIKMLTQTLTAVGFSSPPSWVKPYAVLSGGEKFRCDLARALLASGESDAGGGLLAFDEFTSVVDRTVAKVGSAAIARSVRKDRFGPTKQFVAVTCHYDVLDWLAPDWVLDMSSQQLARGRLQRPWSGGHPAIELRVARVHPSAWVLFRRHHYLDTRLMGAAVCFAAFWGDEPVAFSAWVHRMTRNRRSGDMREHRTVVLPDYQGIGIGNRISECCASLWTGLGGIAAGTTSHPGMIHYRAASPLWRVARFGRVTPPGVKSKITGCSMERLTGGFEYVGPPMPRDQAEAILADRPRIFADATAATVLAALKPDGLMGDAAIARRAGIDRRQAASALRRLTATGEVERVRAGRRVGFRAAAG